MQTAVVFRRPAWQRRATIVLLPVVLLAGRAVARYLPAGGRVAGGGFSLSALATVGEELNAAESLHATGGAIEVVRIRPVGVSGPVNVDVRLVRESGFVHLGSTRGPLDADVVVLPLPTPGAP